MDAQTHTHTQRQTHDHEFSQENRMHREATWKEQKENKKQEPKQWQTTVAKSRIELRHDKVRKNDLEVIQTHFTVDIK